MALQILDSPSFASRDTSSVRSVSYGGAPAPPELVKRIKAAFPDGQPGNGYGLTETSAATSMNTGPDYVARPDSVGTAVPVTDVAVVPEDYEGQEPPADGPRGPEVTGELWVRGPQVVRGYWNRPEETALVFTKGWLHTGDVARIDEEGFIYIVDRAKDVIIRGGENVYSVEVEAALFEHPDVADCAVIGVPHATLGEEVGAVIVTREGRSVDEDELRSYVAERLARYNVPTRFWFLDGHLPRNPAGKVLKRQLRDELVEGLGRGPIRGSRGRRGRRAGHRRGRATRPRSSPRGARCDEVPGIGSITALRCRSHARETWAGVAPSGVGHAGDRGVRPGEGAGGDREVREEPDPGRLAALEHRLAGALGDVVGVLDRRDRDDAARRVELLDGDLREPDRGHLALGEQVGQQRRTARRGRPRGRSGAAGTGRAPRRRGGAATARTAGAGTRGARRRASGPARSAGAPPWSRPRRPRRGTAPL